MTFERCWCGLQFEATCDRCDKWQDFEDDDVVGWANRSFREIFTGWLSKNGWRLDSDGKLLCPDCVKEVGQ